MYLGMYPTRKWNCFQENLAPWVGKTGTLVNKVHNTINHSMSGIERSLLGPEEGLARSNNGRRMGARGPVSNRSYGPVVKERAMVQDLTYLIALSKIERIGPVLSRRLIDYFGDVKDIFASRPSTLEKIPKIGSHLAQAIRKASVLKSAEQELEFAAQNGVRVSSVYDDDYPWMLKNIHDAPLLLYQKGELKFNDGLNIAIVGTRKPSGYGRSVAEYIAKYLSGCGVNVVSGLAYGIDSEAHKAVLNSGGATTAVLGHGLGTIYPREHAWDAERIKENGALITEFHSQVGPEGRNFPLRNRIIAGLCQCTIVIEAGTKGGALITAKLAFEQDREVYAVPGDITRATSIGCNQLIRDQIASILTHPQDVLDNLAHMLDSGNGGKGGPQVKDINANNLSETEKRALSRIEEGACSLNEMMRDLEVGESLYGALIELEGKGLVRMAAGGVYSRC